MPKPRVLAILSLFALSAILVACGSEEEEDPTPEPTPTVEATTAATETEEAEETEESTTIAVATPADSGMAATPVDSATPEDSAVVATPAESTVSATPVEAAPGATAVEPTVVMTPVTASVEFTGAEQRDYMITEEGCVGIGEWSPLKTGAQVIVRDATGTVVDVAELETAEGTDGCSWTADLSVPNSEFVSISIPMVTEVWFDQADFEAGDVSITIP